MSQETDLQQSEVIDENVVTKGAKPAEKMDSSKGGAEDLGGPDVKTVKLPILILLLSAREPSCKV